MTSNKFINAAKNAVIDVAKHELGIDVDFDSLQLVWFAHELGYKKCTLFAKELDLMYPEVTYNLAKNEMYVDMYKKTSNTVFDAERIEFLSRR